MLDPDLDEYLSEYRLQTPVEPISHYADGELEAQWLMAAGFPHLTRAFEEGRELPTSVLSTALSGLSQSHAEAVKQRVKALNRTVRGRTRSRHQRKPDIRDVFRDVDTSSTGTRSRSATPDSLDSIPGDEHWNTNQQVPNFVSIFDGGATLPTLPRSKQNLRRTPSAPLRGSAELFRGSHVRCDIPFFTEGIELVGFQRLGTIHIPRVRSGSDPSVGRRNDDRLLTGRLYDVRNGDSSQSSSPLESPTNSPPRSSPLESAAEEDSPASRRSPEPVSFEGLCRESESTGSSIWTHREPCRDVDDLCESDLKKIQSLLWLELAALFDRHHIVLDKRKPFKRKKKEEGNVFGVSLNALVRRDQQITGEDTSLVPLLLQGLLKELVSRGAKEEGILRVAGNKQKIELVYNELEQNFYSKPEKVEPLLRRCGVHDLSAILKRWLRELPQPLLANDLIHLFYQTHAIPPEDQGKALSVLCLFPTNSPPRSSPLESAAEEDSPASRRSPEPVSFEGLCRESESTGSSIWTHREPCCDVDDLCESDLKKIQSLLWLELAALFDRHHIVLDKRKPFKRKRRRRANVFGVSLNALVRRDQQITGEDTSLVPLLLQGLLKELVSRGAKEEGILRVAGNKQKKVEPLLRRCGVHDLSAILKRWLRELPQPLLANDLIHLFYQTHAIPPEDQGKALSVLCLLLPHENRNTLRAFLEFLRTVVALQSFNKMSNHNVATIIAPSLFPPRFVHPGDKNDIGAQVRMAAQCCRLTDILISQEESLWMVPQRLLNEARSMNKPRLTKSKARKTKSESSAEIRINHNPSHIHRLVV
uniref:Putative rho gtpase-activating protein 18 n=1 Tax=Lutzomyia longipalpis TaxID=7200 RepID=A0A1B0CRK6_LUTLO